MYVLSEVYTILEYSRLACLRGGQDCALAHAGGEAALPPPMSDPPRAAVVLSGHLRATCEDGGAIGKHLIEELRACRRRFPGGCDVFGHTWSTLDAPTRAWNERSPVDSLDPRVAHHVMPRLPAEAHARPSRPCVLTLQQALSPSAVTVEIEEQAPLLVSRAPAPVAAAAVPSNVTWGQSSMPWMSMVMNYHSVARAAAAVPANGSAYAAAVRMRFDVGSLPDASPALHVGSGMRLAEKGWAAVRAAVDSAFLSSVSRDRISGDRISGDRSARAALFPGAVRRAQRGAARLDARCPRRAVQTCTVRRRRRKAGGGGGRRRGSGCLSYATSSCVPTRLTTVARNDIL